MGNVPTVSSRGQEVIDNRERSVHKTLGKRNNLIDQVNFIPLLFCSFLLSSPSLSFFFFLSFSFSPSACLKLK